MSDDPGPPPTAQQILAEAERTRLKLHALELGMDHEITALKLTALRAGRPLNAAERARRDMLRQQIGAVEDRFADLGTITLAQLDAAPEIKALLVELQTANQGLTDTLAQLKHVEAITKEVADAASAFAKLVGTVASFATLVA